MESTSNSRHLMIKRKRFLTLSLNHSLMDNFSIQVDREDIKPLIRGFEDQLPHIDIENAEFFLYRISSKQKLEEEHVKRLEALRELRSKEIIRFRKILDRQRALPVVKIKTNEKSYVVKPTHSQASLKLFNHSQENPRFEIYVSELAFKLGIGPKFYGRYYFNPRMILMVEECISEDNGWKAMYRYAGKFDLEVFPKFLGEIVGKLHKLQHWKTKDGNEYQGRLWYNDRVLLHLSHNPKTDSYCLIDFGNAELISSEMFEKSEIARQRLSWEAIKVAKNLINYTFYYKRGITHKSVSEYKKIFYKFSKAYSKETSINLRMSDLMWSLRSKI